MKAINRKQLDELLRTTPDLNATARVILLAYASSMQYTDEVQETWQGDQSIMAYTGLGIDTISKFKKYLTEDGFLITTREEKRRDGEYRVFRTLGRGELKHPKLMRRKVTDKQKANLIPNARKVKKEGLLETVQTTPPVLETVQTTPVLETVQKPVLETVQKPVLDNVEKNNNMNIKLNNNLAGGVADAPPNDLETKDKGLDDQPSFIRKSKARAGEARKDSQPSLISPEDGNSPNEPTSKEGLLESVQNSLEKVDAGNAWDIAQEHGVTGRAMKYLRRGDGTSWAVKQALMEKADELSKKGA